jgi:hypothetical protein
MPKYNIKIVSELLAEGIEADSYEEAQNYVDNDFTTRFAAETSIVVVSYEEEQGN